MKYSVIKERLNDNLSKINDLKQMNEQMIRTCFYDGQIWTKTALSQKTGISLASTTNILQELLKNNEIVFAGEADSTGGRKSKKYHLNKDYYHILKIVFKKSKDHFEFDLKSVNLFHECVFHHKVISSQGTKQDLIDGIEEMLKKDSNIDIFCISIPGVCRHGLIDICDFHRFEQTPLKKMLYEKFGKETILENDVNIACIGFYHQNSHYRHMAFIYQPQVDYVGCGMMIDGKLYNGFTHFAGELRYLPFYTHQQQDDMLQNEPMVLLEKQIETLCCTLNPQVVGICSDVIFDLSTLQLQNIPDIHRPELVFVKNLDEMIQQGIFYIGLKKLLEREGKKV